MSIFSHLWSVDSRELWASFNSSGVNFVIWKVENASLLKTSILLAH
jgi:diphthamide synthase (EF-2-diphthine--ammonia ligase)